MNTLFLKYPGKDLIIKKLITGNHTIQYGINECLSFKLSREKLD